MSDQNPTVVEAKTGIPQPLPSPVPYQQHPPQHSPSQYPVTYQAAPTMVVMNTPQYVVSGLPSGGIYGANPVRMICPYCGYDVVTLPSSTPRLEAWISCFCIAILCFPLFWIPFCIDTCYQTVHTCPHCFRVIAGQY